MVECSIVLSPVVAYPFNRTGGIEKNHFAWTSAFSSPDFNVKLIARGEKERQVEHIRLVPFRLVFPSKVLNLLLSFLWFYKIRKHIKHSDLVVYNFPLGPIYHRLFRFQGNATLNDQRGTGKLKVISRMFVDNIISISKAVDMNWKGYNSFIIPNCLGNTFMNIEHNRLGYDRNTDFVFVGRVVEEKGVSLILEAMKLYFPKKNLTIVGPIETAYAKNLRQKFKDVNVTWTGELSSDEILEILLYSKVFVSSSIWPEAFGIVNIEALAAGCQLCGFNKGALPEIQDNHDLIADEVTIKSLSAVMEKALGLSDKIDLIESSKKVCVLYSPDSIANLWVRFFRKTLL